MQSTRGMFLPYRAGRHWTISSLDNVEVETLAGIDVLGAGPDPKLTKRLLAGLEGLAEIREGRRRRKKNRKDRSDITKKF